MPPFVTADTSWRLSAWRQRQHVICHTAGRALQQASNTPHAIFTSSRHSRDDPVEAFMNNFSISLITACLAATGGAAMATEYGRVLSSTPVTAQVQVPQQQCTDQQQPMPTRTSGGGALLGAVVGGVVGHDLDDGFGRAAATGLGAVVGSVIGEHVEAGNTPATDISVRSCQSWTRAENRLIGYDVIYDYQGRRYATRLAQDPGPSLALNVRVMPVSDVVAQAPLAEPDTLGVPQVVVAAPPTVVYVTPPNYVSFGNGYGYGYGGPWVGALPIIAVGGYGGYGYYGGRYGGHYGGRGHRH
jgi:uncharacterized protein YcfJ